MTRIEDRAAHFLRGIGMELRVRDGEYRVNFSRGPERTAYYTTDLDDALSTGRSMSREGLKNPPDHLAQQELLLYALDLARKPGWPGRNQFQSIVENMVRRHTKGTYDSTKAVRLVRYFVDQAAKAYVTEYGGMVRTMFPVSLRDAVASEIKYQIEHANF